FSVQNDHVHLIAEADEGEDLSRGMQRLASRIARRVNALAGRRSTLWRERYHRRDLGTPRQFRNALVYVTFNARKHAPPGERASWSNARDRWSSAVWVDAWRAANARERLPEHRAREGPRPTVSPETWIARVGGKRHGLLDPRESPRAPA